MAKKKCVAIPFIRQDSKGLYVNTQTWNKLKQQQSDGHSGSRKQKSSKINSPEIYVLIIICKVPDQESSVDVFVRYSTMNYGYAYAFTKFNEDKDCIPELDEDAKVWSLNFYQTHITQDYSDWDEMESELSTGTMDGDYLEFKDNYDEIAEALTNGLTPFKALDSKNISRITLNEFNSLEIWNQFLKFKAKYEGNSTI